MVTKEPRTTSNKIRGEHQGQGTSVSDRTISRCLSQSRPRRTPLLKANHKKARLEFAKMYIDKPQGFCENVLLDRWDKTGAFWQVTSALCSQTQKLSIQRKEHCTYCETWKRLGYVLGLLCCIWHRVFWICAGYNEISRLSRHSGAKCAAQCKKAWSQSQVMGPPTG